MFAVTNAYLPKMPELDKSWFLTIILVIMDSKRAFELLYAPQVKQHLKAIECRHYGLIRQEIEAQLRFEPDVETRNRKPLKRVVTFGAEWEIRFGPNRRFRVFYEVDRDAGAVYILAIGVKVRDRLYIGGEDVEL
jgi:mRNA-degrading endonuclease RelE of RelBE toxin-antitoxin system